MQIIKNIFDLNKAIKNFHNFGFVPTMGGIHEGHISLIKKSQNRCDKTIVSIFINPKQFNDKKDYVNYPKNLNKDIKILKKIKVDFLFLPSESEIYKKNFRPIIINKSDKILCAKHRKGHFEGVLNVMNRLLYIIKAKYIFMGEKDFQQFFLVKKILGKKHKIKIISCPTIRDKNKIALSTRNSLLKYKSKKIVSSIALKLLRLKKNLISKNYKNKINLSRIKKEIEMNYKIKIDYLEFRDEKNLKLNDFKKKYRLFIAYTIDNVRLIDNF